jgi:excisionase family DNA binding protein
VTTTDDPAPVDGVTADTNTAPATAGSDLMSTAQVAARFNRSTRTVRNWVRAGLLRQLRIGGAVFFRADDVEHLAMFGSSLPRLTAS